MNQNIRYITEIAILTAMITVLGAIKIPNVIPGIEFQLSAPLAVAICAVFGFNRLSARYPNYFECHDCYAIPPHCRDNPLDVPQSYDRYYDFRPNCIRLSTANIVYLYW